MCELSVNRIPFSVLKRKTVVIQSTAILLDVELDGSAVWLVMCLLFGVFGLLEYLVYLVSLCHILPAATVASFAALLFDL